MSSLSTACTSHLLRECVYMCLYTCVDIRFAWNGWWVFTRIYFGKIWSIIFRKLRKIIIKNISWMPRTIDKLIYKSNFLNNNKISLSSSFQPFAGILLTIRLRTKTTLKLNNVVIKTKPKISYRIWAKFHWNALNLTLNSFK